MARHPGPVFVTGATGFIGRHIVQELRKQDHTVRALVRRIPQSGFDPSVEVVVGDLAKPETYAARLSGASAVVHTALTDSFSNDLHASSALQKLSAAAGAGKFIHLSSIVVNGAQPNGTITEATPPAPASDTYSRTKLAIERELAANSAVPELLILRLGCVYGPGGGWWSNGLLKMMERGRMILVNGGTGTANLIHVMDVAAVVLTLLQRSNSQLDIFNVTDGMPVSWRTYFSGLEGILGRTATVSMTAEEALEHGRKWLQPSLARRAIRKMFSPEVIHPMDAGAIQSYASQAVYSNEKASSLLDFRPMYDLKSGMETVRLDWNARRSRKGPQVSFDSTAAICG